MNPILVTGMAGFLGQHITRALLSRGLTVTGFDNCSGGQYPEWLRPMCPMIDCCDADAVNAFFEKHKPEQVIHCAAYASEGYSHWCRSFLYQNNIVGTANIVNACVNHGVKHLVFLSSIAVYGNGGHGVRLNAPDVTGSPFSELDHPTPGDPYGAAKFMSELDIQCAGEMFGLKSTIFRPHNVYGTAQNMADRTRNFVSIAIRAALEGRPCPVYGDGHQVRQFTPAQYVAEVIASCVVNGATWNQIYNVGVDRAMTILEMAEAVSRAVGKNGFMVEHLPARHEVKHATCDHSKARAAFPEIEPPSIDETLKAMVEEARSNPLPPYHEPPPLEITVNAPEWAKVK